VSIDAKGRADVRMPHLFLQNRDRRILVAEFGCEPVPKNMESSKLRWYSKFLEHGFQTVLDDVVSTPRLRALQVRKEPPPWIILPSLPQIILERGCQQRRHGKRSRRRFSLGPPNVSVVIIRAFVDSDAAAREV
jgi:hypothetical protein